MKNKPLFIFGCVVLVSCASSSPQVISSEASKQNSADASSIISEREAPASSESSDAPGVNILTPSEEFLEVFDLSSKVQIKLTFDEDSLHDLSYYGTNFNRKYSDIYFPGRVEITVNGASETFEEAGIRMKGNTSRREILDEHGQIYQPCHFKVSLKATFDDELYNLPEFTKYRHDWSLETANRAERKDRNFRGIEKFDLKYIPRNLNSAYGQEIYAYNAFRNAGLLSPHDNYCKVVISNGASSLEGDYEIIETIDKQFLKRYLGKSESKGDLYKCVYGPMGKGDQARSGAVEAVYDSDGFTCGERIARGKIGVKDPYDGYFPCYDLTTNDDLGEGSDFSKMSGFINAMWNLRYKAASQELLESVLDVDWFLKFEAISYLLGNFDDQRNNYNNYYIYFLPSSGKALYIPYDWDWCLGADMGRGTAEWGPYRDRDMEGNKIGTNIYFNTIFDDENRHSYSLDSYKAAYDLYIKRGIEDGVLDIDNYDAQLSNAPSTVRAEREFVAQYMSNKKTVIEREYGSV